MKRVLPLLFPAMLGVGCSQKYFIVRHAEKAVPATGTEMQTPSNPPLSEAGLQRAHDLEERLRKEKIRTVYSTNTVRTRQTAQPTADYFHLEIIPYQKVDAEFIQRLKKEAGNTLVVGHSNTVDDLVNELTGQKLLSDLPETAYDNLFILRKKGKRILLEKAKYGQPTP